MDLVTGFVAFAKMLTHAKDAILNRLREHRAQRVLHALEGSNPQLFLPTFSIP